MDLFVNIRIIIVTRHHHNQQVYHIIFRQSSLSIARISLNFFDLRRLLNKNNLKINLSQHLQDYIAAEDGTTNLLIEVFNIVKVM